MFKKTKVIPQSFIGLLYEDGVFKKALGPGKHVIKQPFSPVQREVRLFDMRERSLTIKGQEILTEDKVAVRVSILVYYKITDAVAAAHNVSSYEERIYEDVQLAARRFLASRKLDAILSDRNEISTAVRDAVSSAASGYGVEILRADVKDLVFPGNLREIMNRVLETERLAEAKIIEAKKEAESSAIKAEAERQRQRLEAEATQEQKRLALEARLAEVQALKEHPELLKILKLKTLSDMAQHGGKFVVGSDLLKDELSD